MLAEKLETHQKSVTRVKTLTTTKVLSSTGLCRTVRSSETYLLKQESHSTLFISSTIHFIHCSLHASLMSFISYHASFPPPTAHLSGSHGFKPSDRKKTFSVQNLIARMKGWYPCSCWLPSNPTCSLLPRIFLPLFLLPLESLGKLLTLTWTHTYFPIFLSNTHNPHLGNSYFWACFVGT